MLQSLKKDISDFDLSNNVVQSNWLIMQANWSLKKTNWLLLKVLISCINTDNPSNVVKIKKSELVKFIDDPSNKNHSFIKKALRELRKQELMLLSEDGKGYLYIGMLNSVYWKKDTDIVSVEFHDVLMPYLIDLKRNFLKYNVRCLESLNSIYSCILFELLLCQKRKFITDTQSYEILNFEMPMHELRILTNTMNKYKEFKDFETRVLKVAKEEINGNTKLEFLCDYEKIKVGRRIEGIRFLMRKRTTDDIANETTEF